MLIAHWHHQFIYACGFGDPVMWQNFVLQAVDAVSLSNGCMAVY